MLNTEICYLDIQVMPVTPSVIHFIPCCIFLLTKNGSPSQTAWLNAILAFTSMASVIDTTQDNLTASPRYLGFEHNNSSLPWCLSWGDIWGCNVYREREDCWGSIERLGGETRQSQNER